MSGFALVCTHVICAMIDSPSEKITHKASGPNKQELCEPLPKITKQPSLDLKCTQWSQNKHRQYSKTCQYYMNPMKTQKLSCWDTHNLFRVPIYTLT